MKVQYKRAITVAAAIGIVSMLLTGCASAPDKPQDIVKGYLEAIQVGDSKAALALVKPSDDSSTALLTDRVLKKSKKIKNIKLYDALGAGSDPSISIVKAKYDLAGKTLTAEFEAVQVDGEWEITPSKGDGYGHLELPFNQYISGITVNGVEFKSGKKFEEGSTYAVFPGTYAVKLKGSKFLEMTEGASHTTGVESDPYEFKLTSETQDKFEETAKEFLDECFADSDRANRDAACPNWMTLFSDNVRDARWFLIEYPKMTTTYDMNAGVIEGSTGTVLQKLTYTYDYLGTPIAGAAGEEAQDARWVQFETKLTGSRLEFIPVKQERLQSDPRLMY